MTTSKVTYSLFALLLFFTSCEVISYEDIEEEITITPPEEVISYNEDIQPIIGNSCVVCHAPGAPAAYFPLTNYSEVSSAIDGVLYRIQLPNGNSMKMPQGGSLPQNQINLLIEWQENGLIESEP